MPLAMLTAPPVPTAEPLRSLEHSAHASAQGGSPTPQPDRHTSKPGAHASLAIGDRALGLAPSAYLQLGERALLRLRVHVHRAQLHGKSRTGSAGDELMAARWFCIGAGPGV